MCVFTSAERPVLQLQTGRAGATVGTYGVGALTSHTQAFVLTFIHICSDTHTHTHVDVINTPAVDH